MVRESAAFLYTTMNNWKLKLKIVPSLVATKKGEREINLIKDAQDLYAENHKMLVKEIKDK